MDFYHAAFLAGRVMVLLGVVVTLLGFISVIQQDSRRAFRRPEDDAHLAARIAGRATRSSIESSPW